MKSLMFTLSLQTAALLAILPFTASASARGEALSSAAKRGAGATTQQKIVADPWFVPHGRLCPRAQRRQAALLRCNE